jgi:hypothetical protein
MGSRPVKYRIASAPPNRSPWRVTIHISSIIWSIERSGYRTATLGSWSDRNRSLPRPSIRLRWAICRVQNRHWPSYRTVS